MDWLELAEDWLDQNVEVNAAGPHVHDETYAATLIVIAQELRQIRQLLEHRETSSDDTQTTV